MTKLSSTVLIFGGSRGIGSACCKAFADANWQVASTYTSEPPSQSAGPAYKVDVRDAAGVAEVFDRVAAEFGGPPSAVIANAGINRPPNPMASFPQEDFKDLVDVNIFGAFNVLSEAARRVPNGGSIVALTTSMVGVGIPGGGPYTATKAAVESLVRSMSKELAARQIRVNAVAPGPVDTDLFRAGKTDEAKQRSAALSPLNRIGRTDEIAEVVLFVASQKASWITGQIVRPNGGMI
jgi:3-oxoacyl-[acyl-carrier protein] reductase